MPDREKVIMALEKGIATAEAIEAIAGGFVYITNGVARNALELLKAQEPVKPVVDIDTWKCGNCGHTLEHQELLGDNVLFHEQYNHCPECGKKVKWDA